MPKPKKQKTHHRSKHLHLSRHKHTGKLMPHGSTSYRALMVLAAIAGFILFFTAASARAATISVGATVSGPPPALPAVITSPANNSTVTVLPTLLSGTCDPGSVVRAYRDDIFAGSTLCSIAGRFELYIDLAVGRNVITVKNFDVLEQPGPASDPLILYYSPTTASSPSTPQQPSLSPVKGPSSGANLLFLSTSKILRNIKPHQAFSIPITITGGTAPYEIVSSWSSDGTVEKQLVPAGGEVTLQHTYTKPGSYIVVFVASDTAGNRAYLQMVVVVDGEIATPFGTIDSNTDSGDMYLRAMFLLPYYLMAVAILIAFWLGEQYSIHGYSMFISRFMRPKDSP